jgi:hypothetical protein
VSAIRSGLVVEGLTGTPAGQCVEKVGHSRVAERSTRYATGDAAAASSRPVAGG